jgi:hypothetical protein
VGLKQAGRKRKNQSSDVVTGRVAKRIGNSKIEQKG